LQSEDSHRGLSGRDITESEKNSYGWPEMGHHSIQVTVDIYGHCLYEDANWARYNPYPRVHRN